MAAIWPARSTLEPSEAPDLNRSQTGGIRRGGRGQWAGGGGVRKQIIALFLQGLRIGEILEHDLADDAGGSVAERDVDLAFGIDVPVESSVPGWWCC